MATTYTILETQPAVYQDNTKGIVNGVLVKVRLDDYDEVHEVRVPKMDVALVKSALDDLVKQRDALASLGQTKAK
jgi:hypothetical protein